MKKISEELKSPKCCGSTGEKDQLIELAEDWEEKVRSLLNEVDELNSDLNSAYDDLSELHEIQGFDKEEFAKRSFYAGLNAFNNKRTSPTKSWLNYKIEAKL